MKKVIRLTESDLNKIVRRVIKEADIDVSGLEYSPDDDESTFETKIKAYGQRKDIGNKFLEKEEYPISKSETDILISLAQSYCKTKDWQKDPVSMRCNRLRSIIQKLEDAYKTNFLKPPAILSPQLNKWGGE